MKIDPIAFSIGPLDVHWYGIMYLIAFATAWWLGTQRLPRLMEIVNKHNPNGFGGKDKTENGKKKKEDKAKGSIAEPDPGKEIIADLIFYGALGAVLGGRIGWVLFYKFDEFLARPAMAIEVWHGGMSFHGGVLGVMLATFLYARKLNIPFFSLMDFVAPLAPLGLGAGRFGNFINGELYGKPTDLPWGMVFRNGDVPRHPSQLYELALEGLVLFAILWWFSSKPRPVMAVSGLFALGYGCFRFLVEFVRLPDDYLGYLAFNWVTMGQILSTPLILIGVILIWLAYHNKSTITGSPSNA